MSTQYFQDTILRGNAIVSRMSEHTEVLRSSGMSFAEACDLGAYLQGFEKVRTEGVLRIEQRGRDCYVIWSRYNKVPEVPEVKERPAPKPHHTEVDWAKIKQAVDTFKKTGKAPTIDLGISVPARKLVVAWLDKRGIPHGGGTWGTVGPFFITVGRERGSWTCSERWALEASVKKAANQIKGGAVPTRENPIRLHFNTMTKAAWVVRDLHKDLKIEADMERTRTGWMVKIWSKQPDKYSGKLVDLLRQEASAMTRYGKPTTPIAEAAFTKAFPIYGNYDTMPRHYVGHIDIPLKKDLSEYAYMYLGKDCEPKELPWQTAIETKALQDTGEKRLKTKTAEALQSWVDAMLYGFSVNRYTGLPKSSIEALDLSKVVKRNAFKELRQNQPAVEPKKPKASFGEIVDALARHGWTFTFSGGWERTEPGRYVVRWSLILAGAVVGGGKVFAEGVAKPRGEALQKAAHKAAVTAVQYDKGTDFAREMKDRI